MVYTSPNKVIFSQTTIGLKTFSNHAKPATDHVTLKPGPGGAWIDAGANRSAPQRPTDIPRSSSRVLSVQFQLESSLLQNSYIPGFQPTSEIRPR
jgi:hypothetical protein